MTDNQVPEVVETVVMSEGKAEGNIPAVDPPPAKLDDHKGHNRRLFMVTYIAKNDEGAAVTEIVERDKHWVTSGAIIFANGAEYEIPTHTLTLNWSLIERVEEITDRPDKESEHGR